MTTRRGQASAIVFSVLMIVSMVAGSVAFGGLAAANDSDVVTGERVESGQAFETEIASEEYATDGSNETTNETDPATGSGDNGNATGGSNDGAETSTGTETNGTTSSGANESVGGNETASDSGGDGGSSASDSSPGGNETADGNGSSTRDSSVGTNATSTDDETDGNDSTNASDSRVQSLSGATTDGTATTADTSDGPSEVDVSDLNGTGTEADPYEISNASELQAMEDDLAASYELVSEIDASQTAQFDSGKGFDPVGKSDVQSTPSFSGSFDGNGHAITGLTINRSDEEDVGLFGYTSGATLTDVMLTSVTVTGRTDVGGFVGQFNNGNLKDITVSGKVNGTRKVGGLVGNNDGPIQNATASGSVNTTGDAGEAGGLVGINGGPIQNATASGSVTGTADIGGLAGDNADGTIRDSMASGDVTATGQYGHAGGLVGDNGGSTPLIATSTATGDVTATGSSGSAGGLVGENDGPIQNATASGSVTATGDSTSAAGGLVGDNSGTNRKPAAVQNAFAVGTVSGDGDVGGLVGSNTGTVEESYFDTETTGQSVSAGNATGLMTAEMQGQAAATNMSGFDFENTWTTTSNYPDLRAFSETGHVDPSDLPGDGTDSNPYEISNAFELQAMEDDLDANYELVADIDASNTSSWYGGKGFDPIGGVDEKINAPGSSFSGTFDGDGHTISGLTIDRPTEDFVGLFGNTSSETVIKGVTMTGVSVVGNENVGGVVGDHNGGTIQKVSIDGKVTGELDSDTNARPEFIGGIAGASTDGAMISDISAEVTLIGNKFVGGVAGSNGGAVRKASANRETRGYEVGGTNSEYIGGLVGSNSGSIRTASAGGGVNGTERVGGLVGWNTGTGTIRNASATSSVEGFLQIGGLVGLNSGTTEKVSSSGDVLATSSGGGLVGVNGGTITNAWAAGAVTIENDGQNLNTDFAGGLVAESDGTIQDAFAVGTVSSQEPASNVTVGGLLARNFLTTYPPNGTVRDSYWDKQATDQSSSAGSATSLNTSQMTGEAARSNMSGLTYGEVWTIRTNDYPALIDDPKGPTAVDDAYTTPEDTTLTVPAPGVLSNDTDPDNDTLTATVASRPTHGTLSLDSDGRLEYTPDADFAGTDSFTYNVSDGTLSDTGTVTITVTGVNDAPTAVDDSYTTTENGSVSVSAPGVLGNDSDVDEDELNATRVSGPTNGSLTLERNGSFIYTPNPGFFGTDSFTYNATDGSLNDTATVMIAVSEANDPPTAVDDSYATPEDSTLDISASGVLGNDTDPNGDTLTATLVNDPANGSLTLNADGSFEYTPNTDFTGTDSFTYNATDGELSSTAMVNITVTPVDDTPPIVKNASVKEYQQNSFTVRDGDTVVVRANVTDPDGSAIASVTVDATGLGAGSSVSLSETNVEGIYQTTFTANSSKSPTGDGSYTLRVTATDSAGNINSNTTGFPITLDNDPPTADVTANSTSISPGETVRFNASGSTDDVRFGLSEHRWDFDANGVIDTSRFFSITETVTHTFQSTGTYTVNLTVSDQAGNTDNTSVTIDVSETNQAPTAVNDSYTTPEDSTLDISAPGVLDDDSDPNGDSLTATRVSGPTNGSLTLDADGSFTYTPNADFTGTDSFTYEASDGNLNDTATVTITVTDVNDAPIVRDDEYTVNESTDRESSTLDVSVPGVLGNDSDPDGDSLSASVVSGPTKGSLTLDANGSFAYTPDQEYTGTDSFTYEASDGALNDTATVTITVTEASDPPVDVNESASSVTPPTVGANTSRPYTVTVRIDNTSLDGDVGEVDVRFEDFDLTGDETDLTIEYTADNVTDGTLTVSERVSATAPATTGVRNVTVTDLRRETSGGETESLIEDANVTIGTIAVSESDPSGGDDGDGVTDESMPIDSCRVIDKSGRYRLNSSLNAGGSRCIEIATSDVVFDGDGRTITDSDDAVAIRNDTASLSNVTVRDLTISDADTGVFMEFTTTDPNHDLIIRNLTMEGVGTGVDADSLSGQVSLVNFAVVDSTINATTGDGVDVYGNNDEAYDVELRKNDINATAGNSGIDFRIRDDGTAVDLSLEDNEIRASESEGIHLDLERAEASTNLSLRGNDVSVSEESNLGDYPVDVKNNVRDPGVNNTVHATVTNNTLTAGGLVETALRFELHGADGSRTLDLRNNTLNRQLDIDANGANTSLGLVLADNVIQSNKSDTSTAVSVVTEEDSAYESTRDQPIDLVIERNNVAGELAVDADDGGADANVSVVDNTFADDNPNTGGEIGLDVVVSRDSATKRVDVRRNRFTGENSDLFVRSYGNNSVSKVVAANNTVEHDGLYFDLQESASPSSSYNQTINAVVTRNDFSGSGGPTGITVEGASSRTASVSITDNSLTSVGESTFEAIEVNLLGTGLDAETEFRRNTVTDGAAYGLDWVVDGHGATAGVAVANNTIAADHWAVYLAGGENQTLDIGLTDNDLTTADPDPDESDAGVQYTNSETNTSLHLSSVNNTINSTQGGLDLDLSEGPGGGAAPLDIAIAETEIRAEGDGVAIDDDDSITNRSVTVDAVDNVIDSGAAGFGIDVKNNGGSEVVTVEDNRIDASSGAVSLDHVGDRKNVDIAVRDNKITGDRSSGISVTADGTTGIFADPPGTRDVTVADNNLTVADGGGISLSAEAENLTANVTATDNVVEAAKYSSGITVETGSDGATIDATISRNDVNVTDEDGIVVEAFDDDMSTAFTVANNVVDDGAESGIVLDGGENHTATWTVVDNRIERPDTGIELDGIQVLDPSIFDVTVRENEVENGSEVGIDIDPESGSAAPSGGVRVAENNVSSDATAVLIDEGPVAGIDLSDNRLIADDFGVENRNTTAGTYVNATNNYWGASDGPGSADPYEDPVTGTLADGSGSNVTNATTTVANVHFDPFVGGSAVSPRINANESSVRPAETAVNESQEYEVSVRIENTSLSDDTGAVDIRFEDFDLDTGDDDLTVNYTADNVTDGTLTVSANVSATAPATAGARPVTVTDLRREADSGADEYLIEDTNVTIGTIGVVAKDDSSSQVDIDTSDLAGNGTQADPYVLTNASELQAMEDDLDANYILVEDINASNTAQWNNGNGFAPVGGSSRTSSTPPPFTGSLDGNNHTVTGLTIDRSDERYIGLFGESEEKVSNLSLTDLTITGNDFVGGLVGRNDGGEITSATASGSVTGSEAVGGLVGGNNRGNITSAAASGSVTGEVAVGGLVGGNGGNITSATASSSVTGEAGVGGLIGGNGGGAVRNATASGSVTGSTEVGGLVGGNVFVVSDSVLTGTIRDTFAVGPVSGDSEVGGVVGNNTVAGSTGTITDSYWDTQATNQSNSAGNATGLATAEMTGEAARTNMSGLDFGTTWQTQSDDYPRLRDRSDDRGDGGDGIPPFSQTVSLNPTQTSPSSLAGKFRVEQPVAASTTVTLLENSSTEYAIDITAPDGSENVTFYLQERAISASQDIDDVRMLLDGQTHPFTIAENAGPGNSSWIAFTVPEFSTRTVTFTSESESETAAPSIVAPNNATYDPSSPLTIGTSHNATGVIADGDVAIRVVNATAGNGTQVALNDSVPVEGRANTTIPADSLAGNVTIETQLYNRSAESVVAADTVSLLADTGGGGTDGGDGTDGDDGSDDGTDGGDGSDGDTGAPSLAISGLDPQTVTVTAGDTLTVTATIENVGNATGTQTVEYRIGGATMANETVTLSPGETTTVEFTGIETANLVADDYEHGVFTENASQTGTLTVEADADDGTGDSTPGFGSVASLLALVLFVTAAKRRGE